MNSEPSQFRLGWPGFFLRRWRGEVPLARLFWRDTLLVGSLVNVASGVAGLLLLILDFPIVLVAAAHFATLPYNFFLFVANWRAARRKQWIRAGALVWLGAVTLV